MTIMRTVDNILEIVDVVNSICHKAKTAAIIKIEGNDTPLMRQKEPTTMLQIGCKKQQA
ncbi:hypothetical protein HanPI659440_Chr01g0009821 [Helianthus annuus]|nr:hypothetical protein HanPI659440_Chr01g0009821 [Helianthus annuus]